MVEGAWRLTSLSAYYNYTSYIVAHGCTDLKLLLVGSSSLLILGDIEGLWVGVVMGAQ